jgi:broad specificity phosphatase PhoE
MQSKLRQNLIVMVYQYERNASSSSSFPHGGAAVSMRRVILARHGSHAEVGRVLSGRSEIGLTAQGRAEAEGLADALDGVVLASLHASPRARARETAVPLAGRRGISVRVTPALDEIDFGAFAGRSFAELDRDSQWQRWNAERAAARCPCGETMAEAILRVVAYLDDLAAEDFPALCVTHCDIIRGLVADQLGLGMGRLFAFDCDTASRTTLDLGRCGARLVALNERALPRVKVESRIAGSAMEHDWP